MNIVDKLAGSKKFMSAYGLIVLITLITSNFDRSTFGIISASLATINFVILLWRHEVIVKNLAKKKIEDKERNERLQQQLAEDEERMRQYDLRRMQRRTQESARITRIIESVAETAEEPVEPVSSSPKLVFVYSPVLIDDTRIVVEEEDKKYVGVA